MVGCSCVVVVVVIVIVVVVIVVVCLFCFVLFCFVVWIRTSIYIFGWALLTTHSSKMTEGW